MLFWLRLSIRSEVACLTIYASQSLSISIVYFVRFMAKKNNNLIGFITHFAAVLNFGHANVKKSLASEFFIDFWRIWCSISIEPIWNCLDRQFHWVVIRKVETNDWTDTEELHLQNWRNYDSCCISTRNEVYIEFVAASGVTNVQQLILDVVQELWMIVEMIWLIVKWGIRRERQRACACAFLAVKVPLINLKARNA